MGRRHHKERRHLRRALIAAAVAALWALALLVTSGQWEPSRTRAAESGRSPR